VRASGKATIVFLAGADNVTYMLASACESVVLAPAALLSLQSLSSDSLFFKDLLGEIGVSPEIDAVGEFKSAGEALERRESSDAHRRETKSILEDLNSQFVTLVAGARGMPADAVTSAIASGPFLPDEAKELGLVDHIEHEDFCKSFLEEKLGDVPRYVAHGRYMAPDGLLRRAFRWRRPQVAVVHACGVLTSGDSRSSAVGARSLTEILSSLRARRRVRAVVLRIDSPGGGAVASDIIHRELSLLAKEKPVVVSMGDIAASGGYYIAAAASAVLAEGTSLTGSIGVIGGKLVLKRLFDRLGIARESVSLGVNAGMFSPLRSFTEDERARHRAHLEHFYRARFLPVVAEGRKMTLEEADEVGRGRVWTGRQARDVGLVDTLGGLHDAIELARDQANLEKTRSRVVVYGRRARLRELLTFGVSESSLVAELLGRFSLIEELAREDLLLLLPRIFRIR
jgi:protease-4